MKSPVLPENMSDQRSDFLEHGTFGKTCGHEGDCVEIYGKFLASASECQPDKPLDS